MKRFEDLKTVNFSYENYEEISVFHQTRSTKVSLMRQKTGKNEVVVVKRIELSLEIHIFAYQNEISVMMAIDSQRKKLQYELAQNTYTADRKIQLDEQKEQLELLMMINLHFQEGKKSIGVIEMKYYKDSISMENFYESKKNELCEEDWLWYILQILNGVRFLHRLRISHQDIKLENVLYCPETDKIVIIDFGVSSIGIGESDDFQQFVTGTKQYMSPQLLMNKSSLPEKNDVWALGVLIKRLLTGQFHSTERLKDGSLSQQDIFSFQSYPVSAIGQELIKGTLQFEEKERRKVDDLYRLLKNHFDGNTEYTWKSEMEFAIPNQSQSLKLTLEEIERGPQFRQNNLINRSMIRSNLIS